MGFMASGTTNWLLGEVGNFILLKVLRADFLGSPHPTSGLTLPASLDGPEGNLTPPDCGGYPGGFS